MKQEKIKKIRESMNEQLKNKKIVSIIDIFLDINVLDVKDYENWRRGQVDYLERVCKTNLSKLLKMVNEIHKYAKELGLKSSTTYYKKYGKGKIKLRFSKSGNMQIEEKYSTVFYREMELKHESK